MSLQSNFLTRKAIRWCGILVIGICTLLGLFEKAEVISIDLRYKLTSRPPDSRILLLEIDKSSLKAFPKWPWPRHYYANVISTLNKGGAKLIALDLDFSSRSQDTEDQALVEAVASSGNVILSTFHEDKIVKDKLRVKSGSLPFPELGVAAAGIGSILFPLDTDGTIRRAYLVDDILGEPVLSLAAEMAGKFLNLHEMKTDRRLTGGISLGENEIRTDADGTFYINYIGVSEKFDSVSFGDVLKERVDPSVFQDKIVLIGATAIELRDIWESPFGLMPGVEIQANTLQTLLSGQAIHRNPPWMTLIFVFLAAFVLDLSIKGSFQKQSAKILSHFRVFSLATLAMAFFYGLITLYLFKYERILLDVVPVLCAILVHYLSTSVAFNLFTGRSVQVKTMNLSTLYSVGNLSLKKQPLDSALNFLFAMLKEQLKINFMILELYHPKTREFIRRMVRGDETERQIGKNGHLLTPDCQKWIEKSMTLKSSHIVPNLKAALQQENPSDLAIRSSLFIPLITQNGQHGVLHFHSLHPQMFQEEDVKLLYTVTNQLSMNIENLDLIKEVNRLLYSSIEAFSSALELRDNETEGHSQRVAAYATEVGNVMALNQMELEKLRQGALLHDIGKIGVPDAILRKPGKLNEAEMEEIKKHPEFGYQLLKSVDFSEEVARILLHHHEKYDGTGYPQGLSRDDIVIYSRIFSVVDAYDAISSNRPYRKGKPYEVALDEIVHFAGTHFDPKVVEAFIKISKEQLMEIRFKVEETIRKRQVSNIIA